LLTRIRGFRARLILGFGVLAEECDHRTHV
jgi:hypothetical protein